MIIVSRQWPLKKIAGRWYTRLLTYPTVEAAKDAQQPGQRRVKTTLYGEIQP